MKNFVSYFIFYLILMISTISCNQDESYVDSFDTLYGIDFKAEMTTRATDTAFDDGDEISVVAYSDDGSV